MVRKYRGVYNLVETTEASSSDHNTGRPFVHIPKPTNSCSKSLNCLEGSISMHTTCTGHSKSVLRGSGQAGVLGQKADSVMTCALNGVESTLGT